MPADRIRAMSDPDVLLLQLEVSAIAARLRRLGQHDHADTIERWAYSADLLEQLTAAS